jgi:general stress protein YciG
VSNFKNLKPLDERRTRQRLTFLNKHGRQKYRDAGSKGGQKSPTKFTSESARQASLKSWEKRRARQLAAEQEKKNEGGLQSNHEN